MRSYEDYREMFEKEPDVQGIVNVTPDHQHGGINASALKKRKAAISHKPLALTVAEVRAVLQASRSGPAPSHLLAYSNTPDRHTLAAWINAGVIGNVREVHNWTNRPFWPQGWMEYYKSGPPVPAGFNWELWQGPEPDRPYHPNYTFCLYRGWYAYGAGCLGDMGFYSLWQPYRILNLGVPEFVEARPNNDAIVNEKNVSDGGHVSQVGLPRASTLRWRHPATATRPSVDTFWYDGGMKPQTPEELYEDKEDLADEGMLFIGDKGKILCDFRGNKARLIPKSRQQKFEGSIVVPEFDKTPGDDEWVNAIRNETKSSKGSFEEVAPLGEAVALAIIALRVPYKRLLWDAAKMEFTNSPEANKLVRATEIHQTPGRTANKLNTARKRLFRSRDRLPRDSNPPSLFLRLRDDRAHVFGGELGLVVGVIDPGRLAVDLRQRVAQLVADVAVVVDVAHPLREVRVVVFRRQRQVGIAVVAAHRSVRLPLVLAAEVRQHLQGAGGLRGLAHRRDALFGCERRVEARLEMRRRDVANHAQHVVRAVGDGRVILERERHAGVARQARGLGQALAAPLPRLALVDAEVRFPPDLPRLQIGRPVRRQRDARPRGEHAQRLHPEIRGHPDQLVHVERAGSPGAREPGC